MRGNLDFGLPGSLSFWVAASNWSGSDTAVVPFARAAGLGRSGFVVERDPRTEQQPGESLFVGFFGVDGSLQRYVSLISSRRWRAGEWHLVVVNWDLHGIAGSLDGAPLVRQAMPEGWIAASFPPNPGRPARWILGDSRVATSVIDEVRVYRRRLTDVEIARLFAEDPS